MFMLLYFSYSFSYRLILLIKGMRVDTELFLLQLFMITFFIVYL